MSVDMNTFSYVNNSEIDRNAEANLSRAKGGGWMLAIALALGKIADSMGENMLDLAKQIDTLQRAQVDNPKATAADGSGLSELNARLTTLGQQLGQMLQAMSTIVKTLGEGNKDLARKQ